MSDIFISYASEDRDRVLPLIDALERTGWEVFWDRTIPIGKTWRQTICARINSCKCMIVAWSKNSVESDWVQEEADEGKRRQILIPVLIDDVLPPLGFRSVQAAMLFDWDGKRTSYVFKQLVNDISAIIDPSSLTVEEAKKQDEEITEYDLSLLDHPEIRQYAQEKDVQQLIEIGERQRKKTMLQLGGSIVGAILGLVSAWLFVAIPAFEIVRMGVGVWGIFIICGAFIGYFAAILMQKGDKHK